MRATVSFWFIYYRDGIQADFTVLGRWLSISELMQAHSLAVLNEGSTQSLSSSKKLIYMSDSYLTAEHCVWKAADV